MARASEARLLNAMRELYAHGWTDAQLIVDEAARRIGGDEAAFLLADRVHKKHFEVTRAN